MLKIIIYIFLKLFNPAGSKTFIKHFFFNNLGTISFAGDSIMSFEFALKVKPKIAIVLFFKQPSFFSNLSNCT